MGNHLSVKSVLSLCLANVVSSADTYDVIIIGSGPGGLVAGEYLSRDASVSVLVLEAGLPSLQASGGTDIPDYIRPAAWTVFDIPGEYTSVAFQSNGQYRVDWVASPGPLYLGKVVGGSSSLNGMLYFHTADSYVQDSHWPYDATTVNANYAAIETMFASTNQPSPDGTRYLQEAYSILHDALSAHGFREVDINAARNDKSRSFGHPPFTIKDGLRDSPAKTFYGAAKGRTNLKLLTSAPASYIVQRAGVASGVVYSWNGQSITAALSARGAVVVAAGAASTPKVLIQSGIGPQSQLSLLATNGNFPGIGSDASKWVVNDNVGNNLFDTLQIMTTFSNPNMNAFIHGSRPSAAINQYVNQGHSGPWASPDPILIGYEYINGHEFQVTGFCHGFGPQDQTNFGIALYLNNPKSRTRCEFTSDGKYHWDLQNTLYTNADDTSALNNYFTTFQAYLESSGSPFSGSRTPIVGASHYGGSCQPSADASDATRCADGTFKVVGTTNVFVADSSLLRQGTVNPYGFTMQIGYQAGVNVAAFLAQGTGPYTCTPIEENTDYFGNDIGSTQRATADLCCADCTANANCKLFVWYQGTCWLKSAAGPASNQPGRRAGKTQATPPPPPLTTPPPSACTPIQANTDITGNDMGSTQRASADLCCADCTGNCKAFVWFQGTCYLKSAAGPTFSNGGRSTGTIQSVTPPPLTTPPTPPPSACTPIQQNTDITGNDFGSTQRASADLCCADCTGNCKAFVWFQGTCYLKSATGPTFSNGGRSTGTRQGLITTAPPLTTLPSVCSAKGEANTDFTGQDVRNLPAVSSGVCCQACQSEPLCNAYTWSQSSNVCYLKAARASTTTNAAVYSSRVNKCFAVEVGVDYPGNDLTAVASPAIDDCCAFCRNLSGCNAWSYANGQCYLKSGKSSSQPKLGVSSATVAS
ncbi:Aste57867_11530 [Aphanomyces stellatus]|uniref:Aste57867_11530 protein n=1 Tax=Aphanomyces stellatus TaxID=120398 RepID=A0A485KT89_9STRA|nr:hypothetical protein As57867_011487 [Aphanomyces stellatus]VFT88391.1 Aste57867_11530 [Aphanomyces stellatus]